MRHGMPSSAGDWCLVVTLRARRQYQLCAVSGRIGGGPVFAKSCCTLLAARSPADRDVWVAMREDVGEVRAIETGWDLVASEILHHDFALEVFVDWVADGVCWPRCKAAVEF